MAAARVAAVVLSFLATALLAQDTTQGHLVVAVTDVIGAVVPGAQIGIIDAQTSTTRVLATTNHTGEATLDLGPGSHFLFVTARGFERWSMRTEVRNDSNPMVNAKLKVAHDDYGGYPGPIGAEVVDMPPERSALAADFISFHSMESPLTIRTAHNSCPERATKVQLERLTAAHDLRQWTFTHEVVIDEKSIPYSHPILTLHTRHLKQDDELLSTYIHEQLHWFLTRHPLETQAAEQDLMKLYPNVPVGFPEGAQDRESTYLHLLVCWLEQQADLAVLGDKRTADVIQFWAGDHYRWVYRTVLQDGPQIESILKRHGLAEADARIAEPNE